MKKMIQKKKDEEEGEYFYLRECIQADSEVENTFAHSSCCQKRLMLIFSQNVNNSTYLVLLRFVLLYLRQSLKLANHADTHKGNV